MAAAGPMGHETVKAAGTSICGEKVSSLETQTCPW
jgi:hypothetical protein